jgi:hypothetical protein
MRAGAITSVIGIGNAMISNNCDQCNTANSRVLTTPRSSQLAKIYAFVTLLRYPKRKRNCASESVTVQPAPYCLQCMCLLVLFVAYVCCHCQAPPTYFSTHQLPHCICHTATQTTLAQCSYMVRLLRSYRKENQDTLPQTSACCATAATLAIIAVLAALVAPLSRDY